jgi:hypothetical protein
MIEEKFTWDAVVEAYIEIMQGITTTVGDDWKKNYKE